MATISAVINTRNEENNLDSCLSCLNWCDEIIVVDMESEDSTVNIARKYTDKVFSFSKMGYVEPARKFAVEQASGDWVLIIDADELISVNLKDKILESIKGNEGDVVHLPRKNYIMGEWIQHTGWWPDYQPRLFRKGMIDFTDQIHGGLNINEKAKKTFLPAIDENGIEHFNYYDSEHFITKLNIYTNVEAKHLYDGHKKFNFKDMCVTSLREFYNRYIKSKGYKDGYRGLFLTLMMGFYRALTYIKLWEYWQNKDLSPEDNYRKLKEKIINQYSE
ncbi:MAG: glycosyltransferase family 2 protein [Oryzomonas sp.]|jgi:glycosyltransferase involved in cell wall biosynthesis